MEDLVNGKIYEQKFTDEYYQDEMKFFNEELPKMMLMVKKGQKAILTAIGEFIDYIKKQKGSE